MRQPSINLKSFLPFFMMVTLITAMIFNTPPRSVLAQEPTPTPEIEPRIVGGQPASPNAWRWQVALVRGEADSNYDGNPYYDQFCGGSLIASHLVLTAAHCVTEDNGLVTPINNTIDVIAGIYDLLSGTGYQRSDVAQIIRHPSYNDSTLDNDLAIIRLSSPVTLGGSGATATSLVPLASTSSGTFENDIAWVTGWGRIANPTGWDQRLYEVDIPVISNSDCSLFWGGINPGNICAGLANGKDACSGDSGGPLVVDISGTWTLVGIVSAGSANCGDAPGIYTRVSYYANWINSYATPQVTSITRLNSSHTDIGPVSFLVTFPSPMTGVDITDFSLTTNGVSGATISGISGSGSSYTVTVNIGSGDGTIRLDVMDNDSILNAYSSPLGGTGVGNGNFTSGELYTIRRIPSLPAPTLQSPAKKIALNTDQPTFKWTKISGAQTYEIEFDNDSDFSSPDANSATGITGVSYTVLSSFGDGTYYWRVRAYNANNVFGKWSAPRTFTIDTTAPSAPTLVSPSGTVTRRVTTFTWQLSGSAVLYEFAYDNDSNCSSPIFSKTTKNTSIRPPAIANGNYYWCVRAKDSAGNWSGFSPSNSFTVSP